jgi:hypothetical protein
VEGASFVVATGAMRTHLAVATLALVIACSRTSEPEPGPAPTSGSSAAPATPASPRTNPHAQPPTTTAAAAGGDVTWTPPPAWKTAPNPSPMRKATYKITKADGDPEDAELSVSQAGGGVEANIKRWSGQFEGAPALNVSHKDVGSLKVTIVEGHGTWNGGGMPGGPPSGPKKDWALLGAIVDSVDPPYFFKLTGPVKTVTGARADFDAFVGGLKGK